MSAETAPGQGIITTKPGQIVQLHCACLRQEPWVSWENSSQAESHDERPP